MSQTNESTLDEPRRRAVLKGGLGALAAAAAVSNLAPIKDADASPTIDRLKGKAKMNYVTTKDGTEIFYKDWGSGQPVVFCHGWPLNGDAWDSQMLFLMQNGYRVIAHDRRGHGRSSQPSSGHEMDTYADDLAAVLDQAKVENAMLVGHSTGGGEVAHYIGRHGTKRVSKAVLIGAVTPVMLKSDANPGGLPMSVFDDIRKNTAANRSQFFKDLAIPFYGFNRPKTPPIQGDIDAFWAQGMTGAINALYDCVKAFSETNFTEDLKKMTMPTLFIHGDDDQIVPFADAAAIASKIAPNATLKVYPGGPHGLCTTEADKVNADLLAFLKS